MLLEQTIKDKWGGWPQALHYSIPFLRLTWFSNLNASSLTQTDAMIRTRGLPTGLGTLGARRTIEETCSSACAQATAEGSGSVRGMHLRAPRPVRHWAAGLRNGESNEAEILQVNLSRQG